MQELSMVGGYPGNLEKPQSCRSWGVGACTGMGACSGSGKLHWSNNTHNLTNPTNSKPLSLIATVSVQQEIGLTDHCLVFIHHIPVDRVWLLLSESSVLA